MSGHEPIPKDGLYNAMVGWHPALTRQHFARYAVKIDEGPLSLDAILTATERQLEALGPEDVSSDGDLLRDLNARAFTAAQEAAVAVPEDDERRRLVAEHLAAQRNLMGTVIGEDRHRLSRGSALPTSRLAMLLNLQHPDYAGDLEIGLVISRTGYVDARGRQLPDARPMHQAYDATIRANAEAFEGYLVRHPVWGGQLTRTSGVMATILEGRLWRGEGWASGAAVSPELVVARAARLVTSARSLGARRFGLPAETKEALAEAREILDSPAGEAYLAARHRQKTGVRAQETE
jgi:hypothetical protein